MAPRPAAATPAPAPPAPPPGPRHRNHRRDGDDGAGRWCRRTSGRRHDDAGRRHPHHRRPPRRPRRCSPPSRAPTPASGAGPPSRAARDRAAARAVRRMAAPPEGRRMRRLVRLWALVAGRWPSPARRCWRCCRRRRPRRRLATGRALVTPAPRSAAPSRTAAAPRATPGRRPSRCGALLRRRRCDQHQTTASGSRSTSTPTCRTTSGSPCTWSGAHVTGGRSLNPYGETGLPQEYPVVLMECRGVDPKNYASGNVPHGHEAVSPRDLLDQHLLPAHQLREPGQGIWQQDAVQRRQHRSTSRGSTPARSRTSCNVNASFDYDITPVPGDQRHALRRVLVPVDAARGHRQLGEHPQRGLRVHQHRRHRHLPLRGPDRRWRTSRSAARPSVPCTLEVIPIDGINCDNTDPTPPATRPVTCPRAGQPRTGAAGRGRTGVLVLGVELGPSGTGAARASPRRPASAPSPRPASRCRSTAPSCSTRRRCSGSRRTA